MDDTKPKLQRVGALWKPRPGSKALGSGSITINGLRQRFVILRNDRKAAGSKDPDYLLMSGDAPEVDQYAQRSSQPTAVPTSARPAPTPPADDFHVSDEDVPF